MFFDTLTAVTNGETSTTHLMYRANLAWNNLDDILNEMEKKGLITCDWMPQYHEAVRRNVKTTVRGRELLLKYLSLRASLFPGEELNELLLPDSDWAQMRNRR